MHINININILLGKVIDGQETLDALYKDYGDIPPFGKGPDQQKIHNRGNAYLREEFPNIDFLISCSLDDPEASNNFMKKTEEVEKDEKVVADLIKRTNDKVNAGEL